VRYLSLLEVVELHRRLIDSSRFLWHSRSGGTSVNQCRNRLQTFDGEDLYVGVVSKAAALGFFLATNHAFVDGNKTCRACRARVTLVLNGFQIVAPVDEQEQIMLRMPQARSS